MASQPRSRNALEPAIEDNANARLNRSPHPYHHQSHDLPDRIWSASRPPPVGETAVLTPSDYFSPRPTPRRRRHVASPSDSGTEADDEKPVLKALTAPPLRPRKGLRDADRFGEEKGLSPLVTPSLAEESYGSEDLRQARKRTKGPEETAKKQAKKLTPEQQSKRRAILIRRTVEVLLLAAAGSIIHAGLEAELQSRLFLHRGLIISIYMLFIGRTLNQPGKSRIRSSWDPAPLLYPQIIPVLVALLLPDNASLVHYNFVLSLCTLPLSLIPLGDENLHWLICFLPQTYGFFTHYMGQEATSLEYMVEREVLALIPPLHRSLVTCIEFLTTTSLLATEVQLLSVGLVNLLLFAGSPQAYILKALLWIGGIAIFASCRHILRWTVSLARVPKWRYRQVRRKVFRDRRLLAALDDTLGGWISSMISRRARDDTDSETDSDAPRGRFREFRERPKNRRTASITPGHAPEIDTLRRTSIDDINRREDILGSDQPQRGHSRRYTLPAAPSALPDIPQLRRTATKGLVRFRDQPKYYLSLTSAQASLLKWLYASIVYIVVFLTIMIPMRLYIGDRALNGEEPFGWALGYLFGDLPAFRLQIILWRLDDWICLPPYPEPPTDSIPLATYIRIYVIGAANTRLFICAYCITIIAAGIVLVMNLSTYAEVDTRRKVFHGMMVAMFGVTGFLDPSLISLAFGLILAIFLLLDLFRASQLPPISKPLTIFLTPYVDGRDFKGPVVVSHLFLLTGCAVPFWLALAGLETSGTGAFAGWEIARRDVSMMTGVVCVGMGDAAASLIGRRYGRHKWIWGGGKSLEGSLAFAGAVTVGLLLVRLYLFVGGWPVATEASLPLAIGKIVVASCATSLTEAVLTGANDNVLVPIILWVWVKALGV